MVKVCWDYSTHRFYLTEYKPVNGNYSVPVSISTALWESYEKLMQTKTALERAIDTSVKS